ncbi:glycosyltransferase family 2 protein [Bacteroides fragilis]|uniref:glycosyltransferase family 2 protein n=1 Tax=Bacteroides fragilis TaxID=817 RepID=UPI00101CBB2F|nr:glycosyltransferase family 2 protein [Bacteroides fragilis]MCE9472707.1 glycosyltransferase [Bacteroides fragilis]
MNTPLITIVTVCYNAKESISHTIESVLNQTWPLIEYIVVDGDSSDGTLPIVLSYKNAFIEKGYGFRCISEKDNGIYDAMNKGIAMASGHWINFMNSGDGFSSPFIVENIFAKQIPDDICVIYGDIELVLDFGIVRMPPKPIDFLKKKMAFCHQASFVRCEEMKAYPFNLRYRYGADYDFFYQCYCRGNGFYYCNMVIAYFESEKGASSQNRLTVNREYAQIHGVESNMSWKLWFVWKCMRVKIKEGLHSLLPEPYLERIREKNYKRLVKRRQRNG